MTEARPRGLRLRIAPLAVVSAFVAVAAATPGCSCGSDSNPVTTTSTTGTPGSATVSSSGSGGSGGGAGGGGTGGSSFEVTPAANDATQFNTPFDATPSPDGKTIYFTAVSATGEPGVFTAPATANAKVTALFTGDPLVAPFGIATATDGAEIYVADSGADPDGTERGAVYVLPKTGGTQSVLTGTEGYRPRGLEVVKIGSPPVDTVYFTGVDPADGMPGLFMVAGTGGSPMAVAKGAPFADPGGVALTTDGDAFVLDTIQSGSHLATVLRVTSAGATALTSELHVGYPAGLALSMDEATLFVSGLDPEKGTDVVYAIDVAAETATPISKGIDTYFEPAGLHRAHDVDVFAWADSKAQGTGTVFVIQ